MTGFIVLAVIALAVVAALEPNHRRQAGVVVGLAGSSHVVDRDVARLRLDLIALACRAETADQRPLSINGAGAAVRRSWIHGWLHDGHHGHHAT